MTLDTAVLCALLAAAAVGALAGALRQVFLAAGAVLCYLADLAGARDRLVAGRFGSRAWGLPAYYVGQFLLALTVGR